MTPDLCIDIGNTRTKWYAMLPDGQPVFFASPEHGPAAWEQDFRSVASYIAQFHRSSANYKWVLCGVNPTRVETFQHWVLSRGDELLTIESHSQIPLAVDLPHPQQVGLDRLLSALAVRERKQPGHAAIVVDAGTAVTVNALSVEGIFLGGAIAPGLRTMRVALNQQTARLPLVEHQPESETRLPGKTTQDAIYLGTQELFLGGVSRLIAQTTHSLSAPVELFLTGGDGQLLVRHLPELRATFDPCLTVEGLRLAAGQA